MAKTDLAFGHPEAVFHVPTREGEPKQAFQRRVGRRVGDEVLDLPRPRVPRHEEGRLRVSDLAAVQRRREWPTKVIQRFQGVMQRQIAAPALRGDRPFRPPWWLRVVRRLPWLRDVPGRLIAFGVRRVRVQE